MPRNGPQRSEPHEQPDRPPPQRDPAVRAARGLRRERGRDRRALRARRRRPRGILGRAGARSCTGTRRSRRCSTGRTRRSRSGSTTASSTSPTTASTGTSRPATATASRCSGRASRATARRVTYAELTDEVKRLANVLEGPRHRRGRPRRDLHADDPRGDRRDARGRPHRRDPLGRVRRVLRRQPARPHRRRRARSSSSPPTAATARARSRPSSPRSTWRSADRNGSGVQETVEHVLVVRRGENDVEWTEGRDIWWHDVVPAAAAEHEARAFPSETPAVHPLHLGHDRQAEGHPAHVGRLPHPGRVHEQGRARHPPRDRRVLVHRRHRLDHRPHLRDLRSARQRRDAGALRGHARHAASGPLVGDRREVRRDDPLHGAHRHPLVHEDRPRDPEEVRPVVAAAARLGGRADQPRGMDVVPQDHRRQDRADRRHVVADRDRRDHDLGAPRRHRDQARQRAGAAPRHRDRRRRRGRQPRRQRQRRAARRHRALAEHAPRHLGRPGAVRGDLLGQVRRSRATTSPATARGSTRTATCGCSAASTT